ncbi:ASCH domain-containing protein [Paenarthrobacter sp.]|uniref:ASCH domain-containing protein n=1 Tax=Paenarthrobacter sp. TaxID=1931993 RepID=UPI0028122EE3|nr:ASCH domain-containing protein [Paenarthrobacter sp.]
MDEQLPVVEFAFPGPLRDRIISEVRSGRKTATSSLLHEYEVGKEPLPAVGDRGAVIDSNGEQVAIIQITDVRIVPIRDVPLSHALAEGEGYATVAEWRAGHTKFWSSEAMRAELGNGFEITDSSLVVLEQFMLAR